jgi:hypothetical protein
VGQATHDSSLAEAEGGPSLTDLRHREKPDGLAVRADEVDAIDGYVVLLTEVLDCLAEHVAELDIQLGHEGGSSFCFAKHGEDGLLDIQRNGELVVLFYGDLSVPLELIGKKVFREPAYLEDLHM